MSKYSSRLDGIGLLVSLGPKGREELEKRCRWRRYEAGEQILDKDSGDRDVYFVAKGAVQVVNYSMTGQEIALARLPAGRYFGELSAIDGFHRSASVVALEDCLLGALSPQPFVNLLADHPDMATEVLKCMAGIIRSCDERIMDLSTLGATNRVYRELLQMAEETPPGSGRWLIDDLPTNKAIAAMISTTRETVSRAISQLAHGGIVERQEQTLLLLDHNRLEQLASTLDKEVAH